VPYIKEDRKIEIEHGAFAANVGDLTYIIQNEIQRYLATNGLRYHQIAEVLGALEGAKLDFIERVVKPYESRKRRANGDVWQDELTGRVTNL
jgi:hypothetical protein